MRIAYVTETWLPSTDGIVTRLTATMRELRRCGHDILVIAPGGRVGGTAVGFEDVVVRTVPTVGWRFLYGGKRWGVPLPRVDRYIREFAADVVHVVNPVSLGIAGVLAARRQRRPLVASYHTDIASYASHYRLGWLRPTIWTLLRTLHARAALTLVTSATARDQLSAHGIPRLALWPRGVDLERFRPRHERVARPRPVALYVGRLAAEKNLERLAPLAEPDSGFDLMLVGDGPAGPHLQRCYAGGAGFAGTLHDARLAEAYRDADLFVFPSTTDTVGLVLLEALACGLPVVAADSPASREILGECPAARLFPPTRPYRLPSLARELLGQAPREALAQAARRHAQQWSWQAATHRLLGYYQKVIDDPAGAGAPTRSRGPQHATGATRQTEWRSERLGPRSRRFR
jgi:glycosyltransferase involved in cell wall biosynthesis